MTAAQNTLIGGGAVSITGPTLTVNSTSLFSSNVVTVENSRTSVDTIFPGVLTFGPASLVVGELGVCTGPLSTPAVPVPLECSMSGTPLALGDEDTNINVHTHTQLTIFQTTTTTNTFVTSQTYELVGSLTAPVSSGDTYQVRYAANLGIGDSVINFTNTGASSTLPGIPEPQNGDICANVYAYSPDEQLVSCCSCNITPNALNSLSVKNDLASNTLTPIIPSALVIKVLVSPGGASCTGSSAATVSRVQLTAGLLAWGSTIHALPVTAGSPAGTYGLTETAFSQASRLSDAELARMTQLCAFIRANGSGYGICKSCKIGGLGASAK